MATILDSPDLTSLTKYIDKDLLTYLQNQQILFDQARPQLLSHYNGLFVWFENGQILDSDCDQSALFLRAYTPDETRPLFIAQVLAVEPKRIIRSTCLAIPHRDRNIH
jgi:hypothetical protein